MMNTDEYHQKDRDSNVERIIASKSNVVELRGAKVKEHNEPTVDEQLDQLFNDDNYLTVPEVAKMINKKESTVYSNLQNGTLPGHKMFGQWRIAKTDLLEWGKKQLSA